MTCPSCGAPGALLLATWAVCAYPLCRLFEPDRWAELRGAERMLLERWMERQAQARAEARRQRTSGTLLPRRP